jgi:hypothetical protein
MNWIGVEDLNPESFTFDKYCERVGISMVTNWSFGQNEFIPNKYGFKAILLGQCDASKLLIRPRINEYAVMLFDETEKVEYWFHVDME